MPPPQSRGHFLVDLVKNRIDASDPADSVISNYSIAEEDLQYSIEFQTSRCSDIFSDVETENAHANSPVVEFISQSDKTLPDSNDLILIPLNTEINNLFSTNEISLEELCTSKTNERLQNIENDTISLLALGNKSSDVDIFTEKEQDNTEQILTQSYPIEPVLSPENTETRREECEVTTAINVEDPDYLPNNNNNSNSSDSEPTATAGRPKRGRKRKYAEQNRTIRKQKANKNLDYVSANGKKVSAKEFKGVNFNCRCSRKCSEKISVESRKKEFEKFWRSGSYEARCAILQGNVTETKTSRSYTANSKRLFTRKYYLLGVQVCKTTFLNTYAVSQTRIDFALNKLRFQTVNDKRGVNSGGKNCLSPARYEEIKQFIEKLPNYKSHYCRNNTTAKFLAPNLNLNRVYDLYKEAHDNPVSLSSFRLCFYKNFNLRFKKPQKDTCFRCDRYKASISREITSEQAALLEKEHKDHLEHAYKLRDQMKKDLARSKTDSSLETLTFDLEKTHCLPRLPTSIVYYKRQLNLHNLGIHCGSNGKGYFYVWLEHEAGRGTQEVGSCLRKFINENLKPGATELILWADSCGGQNRSIKMILMLLYILHNHNTLQNIIIRFLQPGHTYLPNDSEFGDVECALKTQIRLYTPEDYIQVMKDCRRKNKFTVTRLHKEDFRSVAPMHERITNRKMDLSKQKISWLKTFEIKISKDEPSKLYMKKSLEDDANIIDISKGGKGRKLKPDFNIELPILYPNGRQLSVAKIKDLKEMVKLVPADARPFYNFLKTVGAQDFVDDTEGFGNTVDFEIEEDWEGLEE